MSRLSQPTSNLLLGQVRSYGRDLRHWIGRLKARYVAGAGLLAFGLVFLLMAAGVGIAAAFHALEVHYGSYAAYGIVGGTSLLLGLSGLIAGRVVLSRPVTSFPAPVRQFQRLKREVAASSMATLVTQGGRPASRMDPVSRGLAVGAAVLLLGWITANYMQRQPNSRQKRA